eukprot:TRINITY_DN6275_c0_g3_i5.p1 TRINITY_DN6275_c0_g3~~TRINITY_DN6275_c0_g3_i5.p1  ORF type:complete len:178 (+),score=33.87 TRINITY_DN6275_c0_g3_i5:162-695(+)
MGLQPDRVKERSLLIRRLDSLLILSRDTLREIEADIYWCLSVFLSSVQDHYTFAQPGKQWYQRRVRGVILWKKMEGEGFWQKIESFFSGATESINPTPTLHQPTTRERDPSLRKQSRHHSKGERGNSKTQKKMGLVSEQPNNLCENFPRKKLSRSMSVYQTNRPVKYDPKEGKYLCE